MELTKKITEGIGHHLLLSAVEQTLPRTCLLGVIPRRRHAASLYIRAKKPSVVSEKGGAKLLKTV